MKVLVTDGEQRSALATTRSLGKKGVKVVVGDEKKTNLASCSKYCHSSIAYPSPYKKPDEFIVYLINYLKNNKINVLFPLTDVTTYLIAKNKHEIEKYTIVPVPGFNSYEKVTNKYELVKYALDQSVPIPKTCLINGSIDLEKKISNMKFPVVAKPYKSKIYNNGEWVPTKVRYINTFDELKEAYENWELLKFPSMIQECIKGHGAGIFVLMNRGELVATFAHKRLREKPPSGGESVFRESIAVDPNLRDYAVKLLGPLEWHGVAMLEFKLESSTGKYYLIEVNGRFWGSLQLSIDAGIDFPYLLYCMSVNKNFKPPENFKQGVKCRWLLGDLDHLILRMRDSGINSGSTDLPTKTTAILQFLKFYEPATYYEVLSLRDPVPFLYELSQYIYNVLIGLKRRLNA